MGKLIISTTYILIVSILAIQFSSCADTSDSGPMVMGVYDFPPSNRILNYKVHNILKCNITGTTKPEDYAIQWYRSRNPNQKLEPKEDDPNFELRDNDLIVKAIDEEILKDKYTCSLVLKTKKDEMISSAQFSLIGKPLVKIVSPGTFIQGQRILLECQAQGFPKPHIEWRYENTTFASSLGRFQLKDNIEKGLVNYYLQIDSAELTDRGEYACKALSEHSNTTEAVIFVRVKDKFAALWPFIGICAEVVVLCAIIFVYERKRNKAELEESDTDQSPEQKNTPDHAKESVRQRK